MKRIISALLVSTLLSLLFLLTACNSTTVIDEPLPTVPTADGNYISDIVTEDSTTAAETTDDMPDEATIAALELLNVHMDEEGYYRISEEDLKTTDDYDLFREYFFGIWEGNFTFPDNSERESLVIDDSLHSYNMTDISVWYTGDFYKTNDNVLLFITGSIDGPSLHWINMKAPDTMYLTWGGVGKNNFLCSRREDGSASQCPVVYTLTKTGDLPNVPEENFLSIFKIYEISRDLDIDLELLTDITYTKETGSGNISLWHDAYSSFYPIYLVSEAVDKLELIARVYNPYVENSEADVTYTLEKIDGEWVRSVEFGG